MQLLSVMRAGSIWLFDILEMNPRGKHLVPDLIEWLKIKYGFLKYPSSPNDFDDSGGLAFTDGSFQSEKGVAITLTLKIYADGLVADTRSSTRDTDAFLESMLSLAAQDFGLVYRPNMIQQKLYISELNIRPQHSLSGLNPRLQEFANRITSLAGIQDTHMFEPASISFWPNPSLPIRLAQFQFERKLNTAFSEERYFSRAPLQTDDHLKLLEEFEDLLIG